MVHNIRMKLGWSRDSTMSTLALMGRVIFVAVLLLPALTRVEAIDISATGGWIETIDASDLVSGAGSDLIDAYESASDATNIDIGNTANKNDNWRVDVRKVDGIWHGDFSLYARRTSNGNGQGSVSGGLSYIEIVTIESEFFSGAGNLSNIDVQYQLTGLSVTISPIIYSTTVVFTVVDI
jgi:hypothetical protein